MGFVVIFVLSWVFQSYILYDCYCYRIDEMRKGKTTSLPLNSQPKLPLPSTETLYFLQDLVSFLAFCSVNQYCSDYSLLVSDYIASSINLDRVHVIPIHFLLQSVVCLSFLHVLVEEFSCKAFQVFKSLKRFVKVDSISDLQLNFSKHPILHQYQL